MPAPESRFSNLPAWAARLLLMSFLLISVMGVAITVQPPPRARTAIVDLTDTDLALYQAIAARVGAGEGYHAAAVAEQRARDYPLRPIFTVRLPTLAWTVGMLGAESAALLLRLLMIGAIAALTLRLKSLAGSRVGWAVAALLGGGSMALLTVPAMTYWHESWAALLIALSVALRSSERWIGAVLVGLVAVLVRELALPFLCLMAALAWREGKRTEAGAWTAAILIFFLVMAAHAAALGEYVTGEDPASPGWSGAGGWSFVLAMVQRSTLFLALPLPVIALLVPLAVLGWAGLAGATAERITLLLIGYLAGFMLVGRPDNFYWGILIAPLLPAGLAFAPRALRDLVCCTDFLNFRRTRVAG